MTELTAQRRITRAFIDNAGGEPVTLVPRLKTAQASGGHRWTDGAPRAAQKVKLVEPTTTPLPVETVDGQEREIVFSMVAEWDAEIGVYDTFTRDGFYFEIVALQPYNGWERRALVARHG